MNFDRLAIRDRTLAATQAMWRVARLPRLHDGGQRNDHRVVLLRGLGDAGVSDSYQIKFAQACIWGQATALAGLLAGVLYLWVGSRPEWGDRLLDSNLSADCVLVGGHCVNCGTSHAIVDIGGPANGVRAWTLARSSGNDGVQPAQGD